MYFKFGLNTTGLSQSHHINNLILQYESKTAKIGMCIFTRKLYLQDRF